MSSTPTPADAAGASSTAPDSRGRGPWIATFSGLRVYPLEMTPADVNIKDIAHSLANICRFNGHVPRFYSVAQHSVYVARYLTEVMGQTPAVGLWGLLHDAAEAYLGDVCSPIKRRLWIEVGDGDKSAEVQRFDEMETDLLAGAIAPAFGLTWPTPAAVHYADRVLLASEARSLMCATPADLDLADWGLAAAAGLEPWSEGPALVDCQPPADAERAFMVAFEHLVRDVAAGVAGAGR